MREGVDGSVHRVLGSCRVLQSLRGWAGDGVSLTSREGK